MKIRQGFVSNSSSSSFILATNKIPETHEDVLELLVHKDFEDQWDVFYNTEWHTEPKPDDLADLILQYIIDNCKLITRQNAVEYIANKFYWEISEMVEREHIKKHGLTESEFFQLEWGSPIKQDIDAEIEYKCRIFAEKHIEHTMFTLYDKLLLISASDNDPVPGTLVEHGGFLPDDAHSGIRISNH